MLLSTKVLLFSFVILIFLLYVYIDHILTEIENSKLTGYINKNQKYYYIVTIIFICIIIIIGKLLINNLKLVL